MIRFGPPVEVPCHENWPEHFIAVNKEMIKEAKNMEESERKGHEAEISKIFETKAFNRELESMADQQVYYLAGEARNELELAFGRGTINGIRLIQEHFGELDARHKERSKPEESFDPYDILPKA